MAEDEAEVEVMMSRLKKLDLEAMLRTGDGGRLVERLVNTQGTGGPRGLGDPADKTLSDYERDVIIPQRAVETVKQEYCQQHLQEFNQCFDKEFEGLLAKVTMGMTVALKCSAADLNNCYRSEFYNPSLQARVRDEYLNERSHLRNTGIKTSRIHHGRFISRPPSDGPALDGEGQYRPRKPECWDETYGDKNPAWASFHFKSS